MFRPRVRGERFYGVSAEGWLLILELCHFGEVKVPHLHCWYYHVERFLAAGAHESPHGFYVRQHLNQALIETEIADSVANLAVLDIEGAVAGHAGENFLVRIDFADVPEARHEDAALGRSDHPVNGGGLG